MNAIVYALVSPTGPTVGESISKSMADRFIDAMQNDRHTPVCDRLVKDRTGEYIELWWTHDTEGRVTFLVEVG